MKTNWDTYIDNTPYYINVHADEVVVGSGSGFSDLAGSCTHEEFLQGTFHYLIVQDFGQAVLDEVIECVKSSASYPPFQEVRNRISAQQAFLDALPVDESLSGLENHPETEHGSKNYGNAGEYKTVVKSNTMTLTVNVNKGFITPADNPTTSYPFELIGAASGVVALDDHFYLKVSSSYAVVGPKGQLLDAPNPFSGTFGAELRIERVFRHNERIIFSYMRFMMPDYPRGLLAYKLGSGFIGRWQVSQ